LVAHRVEDERDYGSMADDQSGTHHHAASRGVAGVRDENRPKASHATRQSAMKASNAWNVGTSQKSIGPRLIEARSGYLD
jgi:hypothetical protein